MVCPRLKSCEVPDKGDRRSEVPARSARLRTYPPWSFPPPKGTILNPVVQTRKLRLGEAKGDLPGLTLLVESGQDKGLSPASTSTFPQRAVGN